MRIQIQLNKGADVMQTFSIIPPAAPQLPSFSGDPLFAFDRLLPQPDSQTLMNDRMSQLNGADEDIGMVTDQWIESTATVSRNAWDKLGRPSSTNW
jgi:hypothetical protein